MAETFGTLQARIQRDAEKTESRFDSAAQDAILSAIRHFEHERFWFTQTRDTLALSSGASSVSLPSDFKAIHTAKLIDSTGTVYTRDCGFYPVSVIDLEEQQYISPLPTERPDNWAIENGTMYLNAIADAAYSIGIVYFKKDSVYPSGASDTSIWFEDEPYDMVRNYAMGVFCQDTLNDAERAAGHFRMAATSLARLKAENMKRAGRIRLKV